MAKMKERLLVIWAASASLVALGSVGAVGYLYGKTAAQPVVAQSEDVDSGGREAGINPARPRSETEGGVRQVPGYTVPNALAQLPNQWFSSEVSSANGYAILFNPDSREIIVEQCEHRGYALDQDGRPLQMSGETCSVVLSGSVDTIDEKQAVVSTRDGEAVTVSLEVNRAVEPMSLELRFDDHRMQLQPGSKNDLMQALEARPDIQEQRREYLVALASGRRNDEQRSPGQ